MSDSLGRTSADSNPLLDRSGDFASSDKADTVFCCEEPTCVLPGAVFEILLHIGGGLAAQLILTVVQRFIAGCPRTCEDEWWTLLMTACGSPWRRWHSSKEPGPGICVA